ncbi:MAG TPA: hypothetical protein VI172_12845 [Candidatus Dormibacteraeota bacterium]
MAQHKSGQSIYLAAQPADSLHRGLETTSALRDARVFEDQAELDLWLSQIVEAPSRWRSRTRTASAACWT